MWLIYIYVDNIYNVFVTMRESDVNYWLTYFSCHTLITGNISDFIRPYD